VRGNAGSAATSASFALLRDVLDVLKVRDVPSSLWAGRVPSFGPAVFRPLGRPCSVGVGARSAIVIVDGRHPLLVTAGSVKCGRLFLRSS
jgi:hypothetical protein